MPDEMTTTETLSWKFEATDETIAKDVRNAVATIKIGAKSAGAGMLVDGLYVIVSVEPSLRQDRG